MTLEEFKTDIDSKSFKPSEIDVGVNAPTQQVQVQKSFLLSFVSDATGCGHIRNIFPMTYLNAVYGKDAQCLPIVSPVFIWQDDILMRTRAILFQRQMSVGHYQAILQYKAQQPKYKYKMVWDIDDFIWGHNELQGGTKDDGVPSYNFGYHGITEEVKEYSVKIMEQMDLITVSSPFLKEYIENTLQLKVPVKVVHNSVPKYFWGNKRKAEKKNPIVKPRILYSGSPTHYSNQDKLLGDFDNAFKDFLLSNVMNNKIELIVMGDIPFFLEPVREKIQFIPWLNSYQYHLGVKSAKADFSIGPLVPNNFNYSKSYIKYQEACAEGMVFIGSTFENGKPSPYDICELKVKESATVKDLENLIFGVASDPIKFNQIVKKQYDWLDRTGGYLESKKYVETLIEAYF